MPVATYDGPCMVCPRMRIGPSAGNPGARLPFGDSFQLPHDVANKRIARSVAQRHEDDHTAWRVPECRYIHDRSATVDIVAGGNPR